MSAVVHIGSHMKNICSLHAFERLIYLKSVELLVGQKIFLCRKHENRSQ